MCVLALAWMSHSKWRLVVAGNRDEAYARPTAPLAAWEGTDGIVAGKDLLSGGTWLGVAQSRRFAVVTNLGGYGPPDPDRPSRGLLMRDVLAGAGVYAHPEQADLAALNPFSLITVEGDRAAFFANRPGVVHRDLGPGLYGLSNGDLDEPWQKTVRLKTALADWLAGAADQPGDLFEVLRSEAQPGVPSGTVAFPTPSTGPIFVRNPVYGTRCSTVVAIAHDGEGMIIERRFDSEGAWTGETAMTLVGDPDPEISDATRQPSETRAFGGGGAD